MDNSVVCVVDGCTVDCETPAGAAYVKKVCHPPTIIPQEFEGTPDASAPNIVNIEMKGETNHPPILLLPSSATATIASNPSSMLFMTPSGAFVGSYVFMLNGTQWIQPANETNPIAGHPALSQSSPSASKTAGYNLGNLASDASMLRTTYKSNTFYLNATAFNDQGTVTVAKFKPSTFTGVTPTQLIDQLSTDEEKIALARMLPSWPTNWESDDYEVLEREVKGIKKPVIKKELPSPNYDTVFYIQFVDFGPFAGTAASSGLVNVFTSYIYQTTGILPNTAGDLMNLSPKATTRPAKDGAFVVQQPINTVTTWSSMNTPVDSTGQTNPSGLTYSFMRWYNTTTKAAVFVPLYNYNQQTVAANVGYPYACTADTPWNNLDWSFTLFEGLTVPSVVGTTLSSVPYITAKCYVGMEIQTRPSGSLESFQRLLPLPDPRALQMATGIFHARPDSLPSAANDAGSLAAAILPHVPTAVKWLKNIFGKKKVKKVMDRTEQILKSDAFKSLTDQVTKLTLNNQTQRAPRQPRVKQAQAPRRPKPPARKRNNTYTVSSDPASNLPTWNGNPSQPRRAKPQRQRK